MQIWWRLSADPLIDEALRALHEHAATVVELHRPVCLASGRCCQFKNHDHLLAVTGLEAAWTWRNTQSVISTVAATNAQQQGACAYLDGKLCSIHRERPTGCRTYFCDRGDGTWQSTLSESLHQSIRRSHEERAWGADPVGCSIDGSRTGPVRRPLHETAARGDERAPLEDAHDRIGGR